MAHLLEQMAAPLYRQGDLISLLGPVCFLNDTAFLTRDGQIGAVLEVDGVDADCAEDEIFEEHRNRLESAQKIFTDRYRIYQYLEKRRHPGLIAPLVEGPEAARLAVEDRIGFLNSQPLYTFRLHFVVLYEPESISPISGSKADFFFLRAKTITGQQIQKAKEGLRELETKTESFVQQMEATCGMRILPKAEAFRFLSRLINLDPMVSDYLSFTSDFGLDAALAQSEIGLHPDGLTQGGYQLALLTLRKMPNDSADFARAFHALPCEFILSTELKRVPDHMALNKMKGQREHQANNLTPSTWWGMLVNHFQPNKGQTAKDQIVDPAAMKSVERLGHVLVSMQNDSHYLGRFALRLCLFAEDDKTLRNAVSAALAVAGPKEATLFQERIGSFSTWLSMLPGNHRATVPAQYLWTENTTYADCGLIFAPSTGHLRNEHLNAPCLTIAQTELETPYGLNLHVGELGHTITIGASRGGKTFTQNHLIDSLMQYRDTEVCIWDIGGGYRNLTKEYAGSYLEMRADRQSFTINPFSLPDTADNRQFLARFIRQLFGEYPLEQGQKDEIYQGVVKVYTDMEPPLRRLSAYVGGAIPLQLRNALQRWVRDGQYARWFDNATDTVTFQSFQTLDFRNMEKFPEVVQPLMMYRARRFRQVTAQSGKKLKVLLVDEAWKFLTTQASQEEILDAIKTGAKEGLMVLLAAQNVEDFDRSGMWPQIEGNCATRIFTAVSQSTVPKLKQMFSLTGKEAQKLAGLQARRDLLVKHLTGESQVLRFRHSDTARVRYTGVLVEEIKSEGIIQHA
ncbi:MAG: VirB4 family type IV secretion system protein [Ktedonobacteraceae bacterium]